VLTWFRTHYHEFEHVNPQTVKVRVENLMDREYCERAEDDRNMLVFIA